MKWEDRFLSEARRRGVRSTTLNQYETKLRILREGFKVDLNKCSERQLRNLLDELSKGKRTYYRNFCFFIRSVLRFLGRERLVGVVQLPRAADRVEYVKEKVIPAKDVKRLIDKADSLQLRLLVELFAETGARIGEINNLRIKDVQFDEHSGILWLKGKSKPRSRRVYFSVPDLKKWINEHHNKADPEARFFRWGYSQIEKKIKGLGLKVLKRNIHPHMFRHTKATEDSRLFTDREMMVLFGWTTPSTIEVYSHLSMKDVDDKDLILHGLKSKEEVLHPLVKVRKCPHCKEDNAPVAMFCHKCGRSLTRQDMSDEELKEYIMKMVREAK